MTLKEIMNQCSMRDVCEVRQITDDYAELVLYNRNLDPWNRILCDILGSPKKPTGAKPSEEDLYSTKDYGGIWGNQTLFRKEFDDFAIMAMYWPWQDCIHTTLKMINVKK